jgi:phosphatidylinositol kinase/protein kinase (PI-3  family)
MSRRIGRSLLAGRRSWQRGTRIASEPIASTTAAGHIQIAPTFTPLQQRHFTYSPALNAEAVSSEAEANTPVKRYSHLVETGILKEDSHQRDIVEKKLERLHNELKVYKQKVQPEKDTIAEAGGGVGFVSGKGS